MSGRKKEETMHGQVKFVFLSFVVAGAQTRCSETKDELVPPSPEEPQEPMKSSPEGYGQCRCPGVPSFKVPTDPPKETEKVETSGTEAEDERGTESEGESESEGIWFTPEEIEREWVCAAYHEPTFFEIEEGAPAVFLLQIATSIRYCVEVLRESGYITISHDVGDVDRTEDRFLWCLEWEVPDPVSDELEAVRLEVLSLTPSASFTINFWREEGE